MMMSHTPGPWDFRLYYQSDEEIAQLKSLGMKPTHRLMNDGSAIVMGPEYRVALVDCQTPFKRGQGYATDCAERNANARLIAAAPELLEALKELCDRADHYPRDVAGSLAHIRAFEAIAKATEE